MKYIIFIIIFLLFLLVLATTKIPNVSDAGYNTVYNTVTATRN